ncbi:MAG: Serine/threonine-protein phosphatase 6 catalytic subunit [Marteilia pararefringens]
MVPSSEQQPAVSSPQSDNIENVAATAAAAAMKDPEVPSTLCKFCDLHFSSSTSSPAAAAADASTTRSHQMMIMNEPQFWLSALIKNRYLNEMQVFELCRRVKSILVKLPNVMSVQSPCFIVGDIHGQFYDILRLFEDYHFVLRTIGGM